LTPRPTLGRWSTYTVLGLTGYVVASIVSGVLAWWWELPLGARAIAIIGPPCAFIVVVTVATAIKGREWIVFYQALFAGAAVTAGLGLATGAQHLGRMLDIAVLGTGVFLVLGRIGCFHVACCHGRPARRGVVYGAAHVALGLWRRCAHRPVFPIQLVESALALALVVAGLLASEVPGRGALVFAEGYAIARFALELVRGDPQRPHALGLSEAQWSSLVDPLVCAIVWPTPVTLAILLGLATAAAVLVARRQTRALLQPAHLHELDELCDAILADPAHARRDTSAGVGVSLHALPDGRRDWVLSSPHPRLRELATRTWPDGELVAGRTPGLLHVVVWP
jgi:prolipoprotein diacylglyceryltransferase